jgi:two-component system, chemotaxis family, protein-glutamate methylesterase/glutaminase
MEANLHMPGRDIIVIGASAGGVQALMELVSGLPHDFPAAIFVAVHTSPSSPGVLPRLLDRSGPLPCQFAIEDRPIRPGTIMVAPPDHHLLVKRGRVVATRGPKENGFRPAVDPLFRTAARAYGPRVVGVVLSGGLDDGTEGLALIKQLGGVALVQDPEEAAFPSMPTSAVQNVDVDQVLRIGEMPAVLVQLALEPIPAGPPDEGNDPMSDDMSNAGSRDGNGEVRDLAEGGDASLQTQDIHVPPSGLTCPECGGAVWELGNGRLTKYRCHVGHSYTPQGLAAAQSEDLEAALWSALRALEESAELRRRMAARSRKGNWEALTTEYERLAAEAEARAGALRKILLADGGEAEAPGMAQARTQRGRAEGRARRRSVGRPVGEPESPPASEKPAVKLTMRKARAVRAAGQGAQSNGNGNGNGDGNGSGSHRRASAQAVRGAKGKGGATAGRSAAKSKAAKPVAKAPRRPGKGRG